MCDSSMDVVVARDEPTWTAEDLRCWVRICSLFDFVDAVLKGFVSVYVCMA